MPPAAKALQPPAQPPTRPPLGHETPIQRGVHGPAQAHDPAAPSLLLCRGGGGRRALVIAASGTPEHPHIQDTPAHRVPESL